MTNQIEIRHLEYFLALADTLHYGKAADKLLISQSALSQQIQRLEELTGQQLFDRTNRKVVLNRAGELFADVAFSVTQQLHEAMESWSLALEEIDGIIRIGFVGSAMQQFLPPLIQDFSSNHPNLRFSLDELSNEQQLQALEHKNLDIGFIRSNVVPKSLECRPVYEENLCIVLPQNHWMSASNFEDLSQLANEKYILFPNQQSQMYYQQIIKLCKYYGFVPSISHRSIHGPTIFKLVESGLGIAIVPKSLLDHKNYAIKVIELADVPFKTSLFAVWDPENGKKGLRHFLNLLFKN
ncbi:LysR substrate-binding domain-containing protein [Muricauda sp. 2012CJ35-5]|uniref:LysR substrate-binding domain-containing protein n=1 Tax=Flagellimonas spongiicola TaxID=2942208 RepID=A0ABT0PPQ4_9FLAO|nr:LysR substrate-binding domain-containing protein [Allomuricauda spongiicola]MCL6273256.1 LysR substrate-binding domain-containing protein [Allomuricauda spongiicola]